jgi:hydroxymethylpyrimidine pyrophosphatase-like HAD family hydrolase
VKLSVLALDYDGTIARGDALDPDVRRAIADVRSRDITVVLVTGRILEELRRVAGDLHFVDAVVAENGAVLDFPASGYSSVLGQPPSAVLLEELRREGISFDVGKSIVAADAADSQRILAVIQRTELPLALLFNRKSLMVLPQGISKASGLAHALTILRLSLHNTVAIGDAENDHELLRACEVGVAVEWGCESLKAVADSVLAGTGPPAVAGYIRELARSGRLPLTVKPRRRLLLGHGDEGQPFELAVRGRNLLIAGDPKSGKSWVTGLFCEQLILYGYSLCILDAEGDYTSLEALPGVTVFGGADPLPRPRDLLRALRHADVSAVIDLSHTSHEGKLEYLHTVLPALATLRRHLGLPHQIVVDEAHYFLHGPRVHQLLDLELHGYVLVTYRASQLDRDILDASRAIIVTCESDPREVQALFELCSTCPGKSSEAEWERLVRGLTLGEAVALPITEETQGEVRRVRLTPRLTPHVRHQTKYIDIPVPASRAFVFSHDGKPAGVRAQTLREFTAAIETTPLRGLDEHLRRGDFSRWIADVFGDYPLAKTVGRLEQKYRASNRDIAPQIVEAVRLRYQFVDPVLGLPD